MDDNVANFDGRAKSIEIIKYPFSHVSIYLSSRHTIVQAH